MCCITSSVGQVNHRLVIESHKKSKQVVVYFDAPDDWGKLGEASSGMSLDHAKVVARNLLAGKPYTSASPVFPMSRPELAQFHAHAHTILNTKEEQNG